MSSPNETGPLPVGIWYQPFATSHLGLLRPVSGPCGSQSSMIIAPLTRPTTSEIIEQIMNFTDRQWFEIRDIPNKGRGLIATREIEKGTSILSETPLISVNRKMANQDISENPLSLKAELILMERAVSEKLALVPKQQQRIFYSLYNGHPAVPLFLGIFMTNAFYCDADKTLGAVFSIASFINHSCLSNAFFKIHDQPSISGTLYTRRHISPGEELTISYNKGGTSENRQASLKRAWGFNCACSLCSLPPSKIKESDARRTKIERLEKMLDTGGYHPRDLPIDYLAHCHTWVKILQEEYGDTAESRSTQAYRTAYYISHRNRDICRAYAFHSRELQAGVITQGHTGPDVGMMKMINVDLNRRAGHLIPKQLSTEDFEKWLWRPGT